MSQRNTLRILHNRKKVGFHAFRRFRTSILRKARVPGDLEKLWLGHASKSVTDDYARQLREDLPFRQEWAERAGLGYRSKLPKLGYRGLPELLQHAIPKLLKMCGIKS